MLRKSVNRRRINLNTYVIEDLKLMLFFLEEAHIGVDTNLLIYRKPINSCVMRDRKSVVLRYSCEHKIAV